MTLAGLQQLSVSQSELVLPYVHAITALQLLEAAGATLLCWEGWLQYPDGKLGHADGYQGTVDTSTMASEDAYSFAKNTITLSQEEYESLSETSDPKLLFCITAKV